MPLACCGLSELITASAAFTPPIVALAPSDCAKVSILSVNKSIFLAESNTSGVNSSFNTLDAIS